jgi:hypothetical protein
MKINGILKSLTVSKTACHLFDTLDLAINPLGMGIIHIQNNSV